MQDQQSSCIICGEKTRPQDLRHKLWFRWRNDIVNAKARSHAAALLRRRWAWSTPFWTSLIKKVVCSGPRGSGQSGVWHDLGFNRTAQPEDDALLTDVACDQTRAGLVRMYCVGERCLIAAMGFGTRFLSWDRLCDKPTCPRADKHPCHTAARLALNELRAFGHIRPKVELYSPYRLARRSDEYTVLPSRRRVYPACFQA